jgi:hypothetical protein
MNTIERYEHIKPETIIRNSMKYLKSYFERVYAPTSQEVLIGMLRIKN